MKQHTPEEFFTRLMDWRPFVIMGNTELPRDPDEDEEDEDDADEPPVVREPDDD
jgi:UDP:flavonoid glycosyltransferase YjiC (YdhE family)